MADHTTRSVASRSNLPAAGRLPTSGFSLATVALLLATTITAVFLAGGPSQGSLGIYLLGAGLALTFCPPRVKVNGRLWTAAAALGVCCSLAFLPAGWWPMPSWRKTLGASPAISLPSTISPEPWTSAFWLAILAVSILVGLFLLSHPLRSKWLIVYTLLAVLAVGTYATLAVYANRSGWHYPFESRATFGFFPNRNHTATFLVTGSILALGTLAISLRDQRWLFAGLAGASLGICLVALLFYSASRAGVVFVLLGGLLWMAGLGRGHLNVRLSVSFAALLVAGTILFLGSSSEVRDRLFASVGRPGRTAAPANLLAAADQTEAKSPPFDFRLLIYRDTLGLIRDYPLTGTGLGCFGLVFPQYRQASLSEAAAIHPESDWLMLAAEAGIPALLCFLVLLGLLARRLRRGRHHPFWPLRWACVAAATAAVLHGAVDVPAHRVELGWWILLLAGWGLQTTGDQETGRSRLQHLVFVLGGIAALALGTGLVRAQWLGAEPLPPFKAGKAQDDIFKAYQHQDFAGATRLARQAVRDNPMSEPIYFQLGVLLAQTETDDAEADSNFKAQRLLNPYLPSIPLQQGMAWINDDPERTAAFWREALERNGRMNRAAVGPGAGADMDFYRDLVRRANGKPVLERNLLNLAGQKPPYVLTWLESATPEVGKEQVATLAGNNVFLESLDEGQRLRFLARWYTVGDHATLQRFMAERTGWGRATWFIQTKQLVDEQRFEEAVHQVANRYLVSLTLPESTESRTFAAAVEPDAAGPVSAFTIYWQAGNTIAAHRVLEEAAPDIHSPATSEVLRLRTALAVHDADWPTAWQALKQYLHYKGQAIEF